MLKYIDKPLEEMTLEELERQKRAHKWLIKRLSTAEREMRKYYNLREARKETLFSDLNADEDVMAEARGGYIRYRNEEWADKFGFCEMVLMHHKAYLQLVEEEITKRKRVKIGRPKKPKKRELPKSYGYDPRKRRSRQNYSRDDWGQTRINYSVHRMMKGK